MKLGCISWHQTKDGLFALCLVTFHPKIWIQRGTRHLSRFMFKFMMSLFPGGFYKRVPPIHHFYILIVNIWSST